MRICDLFARGDPVFSFEFFPPKDDAGMDALWRALEDLKALSPSFVSVTYGAGGSTRDRTVALVGRIHRELGIRAMAHLTCVGSSRDEIARVLDRLGEQGILDVLALRGDPPKGEGAFRPAPGGFRHASELVAFLRDRGGFCVGAACYPEGHVECPDKEEDLRHLKTKVDAGAEFLITQLFFDNADYASFLGRARSAGIGVPVLPGLMPVTNLDQVRRFTAMCGARIPPALLGRLEAASGDPAEVVRAGVAHATAQARGLLAAGAPGIHFYTLNRSPATRQVFRNLTGR